MPVPPPGAPPSIGRPLEPPAPPMRSRQQCVLALHDPSHGRPAWISLAFARSFARSPAKVHAGMPLPPVLDVVLFDGEPESFAPPDVDDVLPPLLGGGSAA